MNKCFCYIIVTLFIFMISSKVIASSDVLYGAKEQSGHYYKLFEFKMSWDNAKVFCESMGGHLATIESDDENGILHAVLLNGVNKYYWLGGQKVEQNSWNWVTGTSVEYNNWDSGEPKDYSKYIRISVLRRGLKWKATSDEEHCAFVCEWDSKGDAHKSDW